jgi:hypothetical protein
MKKIFTDKSFLIFAGIALLSAYGCYVKEGVVLWMLSLSACGFWL